MLGELAAWLLAEHEATRPSTARRTRCGHCSGAGTVPTEAEAALLAFLRRHRTDRTSGPAGDARGGVDLSGAGWGHEIGPPRTEQTMTGDKTGTTDELPAHYRVHTRVDLHADRTAPL